MWAQRCERLRDILRQRRAVKTASVVDPLSIRTACELGYEVAMLTSSAASLAVLGAPDIALLTLSELAEQARRVARAAETPLLVDGEHGFGNALNAKRTVEEIEAAGAAAVTIEDTLLPHPFGTGGVQLVSEEEGLGKLRAALLGRRNGAFLVVARSSAFALLSTEDALRRVMAYEAAGADALFLSGMKSIGQLERVVAAVEVPIILGAAAPELQDEDVLKRLGVSVWVRGNQPLLAGVHAARKVYAEIRDGTVDGAMKSLASDELMRDLMRHDQHVSWAKDFLAT